MGNKIMRLEPNQRWFSHSISFHVNMRFCLHLVTCEIKAKYSVFILELNSFYGLFSAPPPLETWIINFIIIAILLICIELWIKKLLFFPREISRSNCWFVNLRVNEKVPPRYSSFLFSWEKKRKDNPHKLCFLHCKPLSRAALGQCKGRTLL